MRGRRQKKKVEVITDILSLNEKKKCDAVFDAISGNKRYIGKDNIMQLLKGIHSALLSC